MALSFLSTDTWEPDTHALLERLHLPQRREIRLDGFPRGIDNVHVDVYFESALAQATRGLVRSVLWDQLGRKGVKVSGLASFDQSLETFRRAHTVVTNTILANGRGTRTRDLFQLYHLALLKRVILATDRELALLQSNPDRGQEVDAESPVASGPEIAQLLRPPNMLRFRVASRALHAIHRIEVQSLRKMRKGTLGISWPVHERMLFNPLLPLGGIGQREPLFLAYPHVFQQTAFFSRVNRILVDLLRPWVPEYLTHPPVSYQDQDFRNLPTRRDKGELAGYAEIERYLRTVLAPIEYKDGRVCWLDEPDNLVWLLGGERGQRGHEVIDTDARWQQFRNRLATRLERALASEGLLDRLLLSVQLPQVLEGLGIEEHAMAVLDYLAGERGSRPLEEVLTGVGPGVLAQLRERVDELRAQLRAASGAGRRNWIVRGMEGFLRLRRDLKWAWETYRELEDIRLLEQGADANLSRANHLLHSFGAEAIADSAPPKGHVIIKADVRGSSEITAGMVRMGLNPATHFSRNLFDPMHRLVGLYGANKVFIEGDAIILSLVEDPDDVGQSVAKACALSGRMLELLQARNRESRHMGLPELELGIGIAYAEGPPAYLYDQGRAITISPAINIADRLSSCDGSLRQALKPGQTGCHTVEEVLPDYLSDRSERSQCLLRFNVNGIELESAAFRKLRDELVLTSILSNALGPEGLPGEVYHLGRIADPEGKDKWLAIREARVRRWDGALGRFGAPTDLRFYQLVTDTGLLKRLRAVVAQGDAKEAAPPR